MQSSTAASLTSVLFISLMTALIASLAGFPPGSVLALSIFFAEISATLLLWNNRLPIAFIGVSLLFLARALDPKSFLEFANLDVIFFLIGMMTFIGFLEEQKFFDYIVSSILRASGDNSILLIFMVIVLSALLAAVVDEVTSIVIMVSIIMAMARKADISPLPLLLLSIFATNIGSSATVVGNPVGVLIAFRGGLTFSDFLRWATPISILSVALLAIFSLRFFRDYIYELTLKLCSVSPKGDEEQLSAPNLRRNFILFTGALVMLVLHHQVEELFHLEKNTLLLVTPFIFAGTAMLLDLETGMRAFEHKVEWSTLIFFSLLFASVGALESSGFLEVFSTLLVSVAGGSLETLLVVFVAVATLMSAFMDNVLAVSVLLPIVENIGNLGIPRFPFYWLALFSATIGGNLTFIGSTANIVALGLLEKAGYKKPSIKEWLKHGWWATLIPLAVSTLLVYFQIPLMP